MFRRRIILVLLLVLIVALFIPVWFWLSLVRVSYILYTDFRLQNFLKSSTLYHILSHPGQIIPQGLIFPELKLTENSDHYSASFYREVINEVVRLHKHGLPSGAYFRRQNKVHVPIRSLELEALQSLKKAKSHQENGQYSKARKLLEHAYKLYPQNSDILVSLGQVIEESWLELSSAEKSSVKSPSHLTSLSKFYGRHSSISDDLLLTADHMYTRALIVNPGLHTAEEFKSRLMPLIEEIDQRRFNEIDSKVRQFYNIPENNPGLKQAKLEHYFTHIYHSNAIEGNTLSLAQTRSILETRLAVGGKSLMEQNEVLGLDSALRYINATLLRGTARPITLGTIMEIHRRILGFVDPTEAGQFRRTQVFIADHRPPPGEAIPYLMAELVDWFNSDQLSDVHPIELAALMHWKLVHIHPFYDGNGRTARLVMNLILMSFGFPPAIIKLEDRPSYYSHLKTANEGDVRPFIRFIASCTERTIDEYLDAATVVSRDHHLEPKVIPTDIDVDPTIESASNRNSHFTKLPVLSTSHELHGPKGQLQRFTPTAIARFLPNVIYLGG